MLQVSDKSAAPKIIKAQEECLLTEWQEIYPDVWLLPEVVEETEVVALCGGQIAPSRYFPTIPRPAGPVQRLQQYTVALQPLRPLARYILVGIVFPCGNSASAPAGESQGLPRARWHKSVCISSMRGAKALLHEAEELLVGCE